MIGPLIGAIFGSMLMGLGIAGLVLPEELQALGNPTVAWTLIVIGSVVDLVATLRLVFGKRH